MTASHQLTTLAQASVQQLRQALGRLTALHLRDAGQQPSTSTPAATAPAAAPRAAPVPAEWAETCADVRHIRS